MFVRTIPLAVCLLWLAYESHFSVNFFVTTLETGVASIAAGLDSTSTADRQTGFQTVLARTADGM